MELAEHDMHVADVAQMMMYEEAKLMTVAVKWTSVDLSPTCQLQELV
jgi:hypothetical protein